LDARVERTIGLFWGGRGLPAKTLWRTLTRVLMPSALGRAVVAVVSLRAAPLHVTARDRARGLARPRSFARLWMVPWIVSPRAEDPLLVA